MSGKVIFDVGIGEAQGARMLGTNEGNFDLMEMRSPHAGPGLVLRLPDELLQTLPSQRRHRLKLAKQRVGQIHAGSH